MTALVCDICGGCLVSHEGGDLFICESCGTKHTKERAKEIYASIVGTVQVDGIASAGNLLIRAHELEHDFEGAKAKEYYNRVLENDVNNKEAREALARLRPPVPGDIRTAKIRSLMSFGAVAVLPGGEEGLIHISKLAPYRVERVEDAVQVGDIVRVKVMEIDQQNRISLSVRDASPSN